MAGSALESAAVTAQFTRSNYLETEITDRWHFRWTRPPAGGEQKGAKFSEILYKHRGSSATILSNGQPTIFFRPLLCASIH
jgi:hypothetical protein